MPGLSEKAVTSTLRIYNTGAQLAYVKSRDGVIRTIRNLDNFKTNHYAGALLKNFKDRIVFETYESFMPDDIDGDNIHEINRRTMDKRTVRHSLIAEQNTFRKQHALNARPGNLPGIMGGRASPLSQDDIVITSATTVNIVDLASNSDPMYVKEHGLLLAYGSEGLRRLRMIPHPECDKSAEQIVQNYLAKMENRVVDEIISSLTKGPSALEEREWDLDGVVPYAILIIDNHGRIGDRWYFADGDVHCIKAMPMPGVKEGIYVVRQVANEYEIGRNRTRVSYYSSALDVKEYKLFSTIDQARCSEEYQATLEFKRKIALNEQQAAMKEKEHQMAQEKFDREVHRMKIEKDSLERDVAAAEAKFEREQQRAKLEAERYERDRQAADERFKQEQEKFERERQAAKEKFRYDQDRLNREREAFEAKTAFEKTNGKMKFFTEAMKSIVAFATIVVPIGMKIHSVLKARALARAVVAAAV